MATFWERIQAAAKAAMATWAGAVNDAMDAPGSMYFSLDDDQRARVARYQLLWKYYHGHHKQHLKRRMTKEGFGPDDNVTVNISRRVVNKGTSFLFGKPIEWELQEGEQTPEEQLLDDIWQSRQWRQAFLQEVALNGSVTGDFYFQILPPTAGMAFVGERLPLDMPRTPQQMPRIVNVDPAIVFPRWNPDDVTDVWAWELRWRTGQEVKRTIHSLRDDGVSWETWVERLERGRWLIDVPPERWPWPWPMLIHGKNLPNPNEFHGLSDLEDADLNDKINLVASNINRITRIFAHPIIWGRMLGDAEFMDSSQMILSQRPEAMMGALELAKDLGSSQEYLKFLRTMFAEITQVPENDPDRLGMGAQSGFALRILFGDLLDKTDTKRNLYGMALVELNRRLLDMMGMGPDNIVTLHWKDPLPVDERSEVAAAQFDLGENLASRETMQRKRGYDPETENPRIQAEQAQRSTLGEELLRTFERGNTGVMDDATPDN